MTTIAVSVAGAENWSARITQLVDEATWKDILIDLVRKNQIDPWNIDIVEVVDQYISAVKEMRSMDLRLPANIILASAILLRLKSETLQLGIAEDLDEDVEEPGRREVPDGQLQLRLRLPQRRHVTLQELIGALEEAMKLRDLKAYLPPIADAAMPEIKFNPVSIEEEMEQVYAEIKRMAGKGNMLTFSDMAQNASPKEMLPKLFVPLLFLSHRNRVTLFQERFFGEIVITITGG
jgi:segregation and condensation protein A